MKNSILSAFDQLGFHLKDIDGLGFTFNHEGLHYLYLPNESDEHFLCISLPSVCNADYFDIPKYCLLAERLNSSLKYVKAYTLGNSLWLFYERALFAEADLNALLLHMVGSLEKALRLARQLIDELDSTQLADCDAESKVALLRLNANLNKKDLN